MKRTDKGSIRLAWLFGAAIIVAAYVLCLALKTWNLLGSAAMIFLMVSPILGGAVSAYLAPVSPARKIAVAISMGGVAAIAAGVLKILFLWTDRHVNVPNDSGVVATVLGTLLYGTVFAAIGGVFGTVPKVRKPSRM
ncbi:hypothetical protein FNU76_21800 [Chitinimonas arctica]|uniref:Uncharacterized protein n=1 Tax=Chitinimonas arctica TaxID=2594795 RepID=A0A516SKT7_9NEIS|nr:hypothetical protein [Chitinimonas arctica]QDQ28771.1 hypothetical protein FNU76_21800 [Chitinimonas arctica]